MSENDFCIFQTMHLDYLDSEQSKPYKGKEILSINHINIRKLYDPFI